MHRPDEAWEIILGLCSPLESERVPLLDAFGRVAAEAVVADRDLPPADRAAMDGYALRSADLLQTPARLRVVGEVAAGSDAGPIVGAGTCARIFTGANLPPGGAQVQFRAWRRLP